MKTFLNLIRWKNIFIIIGLFILYQYCFFTKNFQDSNFNIIFILALLGCTSITAAGNIINDFFDKKIDSINRPNKLFVTAFTKTKIYIFYFLLNILALVCGWIIYIKTNNLLIFEINLFSIILLFLYSYLFKKIFLLGNLIIALLSSIVIFYIWQLNKNDNQPIFFNYYRVQTITIIYLFFAFILSLIREIIKDIEDITGDKLNQCYTIPILIGINSTILLVKILLIFVFLIINGMIFINPILLFNSTTMFFLFLLNYFIIQCLRNLNNKADKDTLHKISQYLKYIFIIGISSMLVFK